MKTKINISKQLKTTILVLVLGAGVIGGIAKIAGALTVTSVDPEKGPVSGGQEVTVYGNFRVQGSGVVQIATGYEHTCALVISGQVYCWGSGYGGQLGDASNADKLVPASVNTTAGTGDMNGKTITQITAGTYHTCALDNLGQVYCWGENAMGQLGNNSPVYNINTPTAVNTTAGTGDMNGKTITHIATGTHHTCALDTLGQVYCWGYASSGQIGDGTTAPQRNTPVAVNTTAGTGDMNGKTIAQIATGFFHTCALDTDGRVYCWGDNGWGQLGDNTNTNSTTPVAVNTTAGTGAMNGKVITQISAGPSHTCALDTAGQVYCWGNNSNGQLGDNSTVNSNIPVAVNTTVGTGDMDGKIIAQVAARVSFTCALDTLGQVYCWGINNNNQLGDGSTTDSATPVAVNTTAGVSAMNNKKITQIAAGGLQACALDVAGQIYCWGQTLYYNGKLGNNSNTGSPVPICIHTIYDLTGSELQGPGCNYELAVTMDAGGTPAPCIDVVIASDGLSLTCTTTAHSAGYVDITFSDGINEEILVGGYEYLERYGEGSGDEGPGDLLDKLLPPNTGNMPISAEAGGTLGVVGIGLAVGIAVLVKMKKA